MTITDFIIHRIDKRQRSDPTFELRAALLDPADARVRKFTELAVEFFEASEEKPTCVFADFHTDTVNYPFSEWCLEYFGGAKDFLKFTGDSTSRLSFCMKAQPLSTGGYTVFATLEDDGAKRLLVVMLHPQDGLSITSDLTFADVSHLELKHIDKAALITGPVGGRFGEKTLVYAGFRKAMSQYFQTFLGPDEFRQPNRDTRHLVRTIDTYAKEQDFSDAQLDEARVKVREYAKTCSDKGEDLDLQVVSALVHPRKPKAFATYAAKRKVSAFIRHDPGVFSRWRVIRHKSDDGLVLQFKAETVGPPGTNHRLEFDEADRTLTITNLEDELIEKIKATKAP